MIACPVREANALGTHPESGMLIFKLALRNILRNRRRSLLTIISMGGGYFLLSIMSALTEGSYSNMIDIFTSDHTGHIQIHKGDYLARPSLYKTLNDFSAIEQEVLAHKNVVAVAPRVYAPSLAYGKNKSFPTQVIGIDPDKEAVATLLKSKLNQGTFLSSGRTQEGYFPALIGASLSKNLKLDIGDEIVLISQGIDGSIANDIFIVSGIVGTESSYERLNVYLSLPAIDQFITSAGRVHELAVKLTHQKYARSVASDLQDNVQLNEIEAQLNIAPWQVVEEAFYRGMQADKKGNYVSMGIIIFIVAIGVLNTVLMGTLERTHEFGVLRAIGTRPFGVFRLIILESTILAMLACLLGAVFALPMNYWMQTVGFELPQPIDMGGIEFSYMLGEVSWFSMGMPAIVVLLSTIVVSIFPAVRAASISPLQAMQEH